MVVAGWQKAFRLLLRVDLVEQQVDHHAGDGLESVPVLGFAGDDFFHGRHVEFVLVPP